MNRKFLKDTNSTLLVSDWYGSHNLLMKHWEISDYKGEKDSLTESHNFRKKKNLKAGSYNRQKQLKPYSGKRGQNIVNILNLNDASNNVLGTGEGRKQLLLEKRSTEGLRHFR